MTQWKPKQLEWEGLKAKTELGIYYYHNQYKNGDYHAFCCAASTEPLDRYDTEQEAKAACQADFERRCQAMSEPQPFWKPIEQCPKVEGKRYLLALKEINMPLVARWNDRYGEWCSIGKEPHYDEEFTHYAEIPPLEASK